MALLRVFTRFTCPSTTPELWHAARAQKQAVDITRHRDRYAAGLRTYRATIAKVLRKLGLRAPTHHCESRESRRTRGSRPAD